MAEHMHDKQRELRDMIDNSRAMELMQSCVRSGYWFSVTWDSTNFLVSVNDAPHIADKSFAKAVTKACELALPTTVHDGQES